MKTNRGFTLIELMVVAAIIAIMAAIAIPAYLSQVRKGRRNDVEQAMQQIALLEERYRADCWSYSGTFGTANCPAPGGAIGPFGPNPYTPSIAYYTVTVPAASPTAYLIRAVAGAAGGQNRDRAGGTSCATLYYAFGVSATANALCTTATAAGKVSKCPEVCWGG